MNVWQTSIIGFVWFDRLKEREKGFMNEEKRNRNHHFLRVFELKKERKIKTTFLFLCFFTSFVGKSFMKGFSI